MLRSISKRKVFVGMSGGVDSSVSAALLKKGGYDVTGVFIKVWQPDFVECTWKEDRRDAMRVAAHLKIPFLTLDLEREYKKEVVDYMIREYKKGRTPNPDVMCNKEIKFGAFFDWARKKGADFIATGHYARIQGGKLLEGRDKSKDQSYFLWSLKKEDFNHILFPVGDFEKLEVRKMAKKFDLPNFDKKDSQGLCFIGKVEMKTFLKNFLKEKKGRVMNEKREVIGQHDGAFFYTIGQRHGFEIKKKNNHSSPYYVIKKDIAKNILIVSNKEQIKREKLAAKECYLTEVNWVGLKEPTKPALLGRIRYRQEKQPLLLSKKNKHFHIKFKNPQEGLSSGQSLVIYDGETCLGGGIIESANRV